jgi:hypothetical protein
MNNVRLNQIEGILSLMENPDHFSSTGRAVLLQVGKELLAEVVRLQELMIEQAEHYRVVKIGFNESLSTREERIRLLNEAVQAVEWAVYGNWDTPRCVWCGGKRRDGGHKPDCQREAALKGAA